jgi:hypothetical protein
MLLHIVRGMTCKLLMRHLLASGTALRAVDCSVELAYTALFYVTVILSCIHENKLINMSLRLS